MHDVWQAYLNEIGATIVDDKVVDFGDTTAEMMAVDNGNIITDLSHFGLIGITGTDATNFLQNQFSNDVKQVTSLQSQLNSYCTPKGRILASFRLFVMGDGYYMQLPLPLIDATLKRLRMYVLRSQVELQDVSNAWIKFGLAGPDAENLLTEAIASPPQEVDKVGQLDDYTILRLPGSPARFEIIGKAEAMISLWKQLSNVATPVGASGWTRLNIRAGIPIIQPETIDSFVPQMVNLHAINGVSFKKGCYPGQEIVARMQYLGKLKRRMYLAHVNTDTPVTAGDELYSAADNEQSVGKVVEAAPTISGGYDLLAVIQIAELEKGDILLHNKQGTILEIQDLPYSLAE